MATIEKTAVEIKTGYVLTLTEREAHVIRSLVGGCSTDGAGSAEINNLYHAFNLIGLNYHNAIFKVSGEYSLIEERY